MTTYYEAPKWRTIYRWQIAVAALFIEMFALFFYGGYVWITSGKIITGFEFGIAEVVMMGIFSFFFLNEQL